MAKTLLPPGCYDILPPFAGQETEWAYRLLGSFAADGYEEVSPPLIEYTESLLSGRGAALASQTFRVMDVDSGKVMGLRPDITLQIARIAGARLSHAALPLRLAYAGDVLRAMPEGLNARRQLRQAGIELIGAAAAEADAEVIAAAATGLCAIGAENITIDLHLPGLIGEILAQEAMTEEEAESVLAAVAHKDISSPSLKSLTQYSALRTLMEASGPAAEMLARLKKSELPQAIRAGVAGVQRVAELLSPMLSGKARVSVDLTEARGFEYYSGLSFTLFSAGSAQEIGRGGRYRIARETGTHEATGCTLYLDALRHLIPKPPEKPRAFVSGADEAAVCALQEKGFATLRALPGFADDENEARRLNCTHYWRQGKLKAL